MPRAVLGLPLALVGILLVTEVHAQDAPPRLDPAFQNYQPAYPDAAQVNGEQGDVALGVEVGANGRVRTVRVLRSSGFDDLDNAAIEGVMAWRYIPAVRDGEKRTEWTKVVIAFRPSMVGGSSADGSTSIP